MSTPKPDAKRPNMSKAMKALRRREGWFTDGAHAYTIGLPSDAPLVYACPLCQTEYEISDIDKLNDDHVPSEKLPGRKVCVLTCKDKCNSASGGNLQKHMIERHRSIDFLVGSMDDTRRYEAQVDGVWLDVTVQSAGNVINVLTQDTVRNRRAIPGGEEEFSRRLRNTPEITLRSRGAFSENRARVALLREAYLAAFAALGYCYAFAPQLDRVRRQIESPDETIIEPYSYFSKDAKRDMRAIAIAQHPDPMAGFLVVCIGRHIVLLPGIHGDDYERLAGLTIQGDQLRCRELVPWPLRPTDDLDHDRVSGGALRRGVPPTTPE